HPVLVQGHACIQERALIAVGTGHEVLGASLHPLDWPPTCLARSQCAQGHVGIIRDLDAEAAAYVVALGTDLIYMDAQVRRQKLDGERGKGIVAPEVSRVIGAIPLADDGVVLERCGAEAAKVQPVNLNDVGSFGKCRVHISIFEMTFPYQIGARRIMQDALVVNASSAVIAGGNASYST